MNAEPPADPTAVPATPVAQAAGPAPPTAVGLLVIGDEILSGKRQDRHLPQVIALLAARGMELAWAHIAGDDEDAIAEVLRAAGCRGEAVLSCGGIGATPDDVTRQAAARAAGVGIARHPEGAAILHEVFGEAGATAGRMHMVEFPEGAGLIPNPVNRIPGFSLGHWYFVPGFPEMAWPMLEWVLDHPLRGLHSADAPQEYRLRVMGTSGESDLLHLMREVLAAHPAVRLSSLPTRGTADAPRHIEFGLRGPAAEAAQAFHRLLDGLRAEPAAQAGEMAIELLAPPPDPAVPTPTPPADPTSGAAAKAPR